MKELYNIIEISLIFLLLALIFLELKKKFILVEFFTKSDLDTCRNNNGFITTAKKEQTTLLGKIKRLNKEVKTTTKYLKKDTKRINDLMKSAKKKADKTGANPNAVKD